MLTVAKEANWLYEKFGDGIYADILGLCKLASLSEIEEKYGLKTTAIVTMAEVVEHLYNKEYKGKVIIDDKLKAAIDAYYEQYGVKE